MSDELRPEDLEAFRRVQRLAYDAAEAVARELTPEVTEREAARRLEAALARRGVHTYFHRAFAWFGDRSRFAGVRRTRDFFPTDRALGEGVPAILDVGPMVDGVPADIGYSFSCGPSPALDEALDVLAELRELILEAACRQDTAAEIYRQVDDVLDARGYVNCHRKYPFGVLGHRVRRLSRWRPLERSVLGFSLAASTDILGALAASRVGVAPTPLLSTGPGSDAPLAPGLWAIEPHIGRGDMGAKWEELLLVTPTGARWLDEDVPHVRGRGGAAA